MIINKSKEKKTPVRKEKVIVLTVEQKNPKKKPIKKKIREEDSLLFHIRTYV
ncbi:MAG TPA: hypothetical protein VKA34_03645 [Balneolales bacterium]|nr:hypothetical protein [Balneolales bacterium]